LAKLFRLQGVLSCSTAFFSLFSFVWHWAPSLDADRRNRPLRASSPRRPSKTSETCLKTRRRRPRSP
jgi:hypothetical protein